MNSAQVDPRSPRAGAAAPSEESQMDEGLQFQDFQEFKDLKTVNRNEMFDEQFLHFIKWFKADIKGRWTRADFQRMERNDLLSLLAGYSLVIVAYVVLFNLYRGAALFWGPPLFCIAVWLATKAEVFHMRTHLPKDLTGWPILDKFIDYFGLAMSGVSPNLFKRRHLAAHFNDVALVSKLFSNVWLAFTQVPVSYYLRPDKLVKFILDDEFCKRELINRRQLVWETLFFYLYFVALIGEIVVFNSFFLLCFHLLPGLFVAGTQIMGAFIVHSGKEAINSWESNGLMDHKTATGLFKVTLWWFHLFNNNLFVNHGIHHANPQIPLKLINADYERYHKFILENYENVRYNRLISHDVFQPILDRMPAPGPFSYVVAFFVVLFCHGMITLAALGAPIAPIIFEWAYVDWRIPLYSTAKERYALRVRYLEEVGIPQRYAEMKNPNFYLKTLYKRYERFKAALAAESAAESAAR